MLTPRRKKKSVNKKEKGRKKGSNSGSGYRLGIAQKDCQK